MNGDELLTTAVKFLKDQAAGMQYGEIGVKIIIHDGRVTRIEKSTIEKEQAEK